MFESFGRNTLKPQLGDCPSKSADKTDCIGYRFEVVQWILTCRQIRSSGDQRLDCDSAHRRESTIGQGPGSQFQRKLGQRQAVKTTTARLWTRGPDEIVARGPGRRQHDGFGEAVQLVQGVLGEAQPSLGRGRCYEAVHWFGIRCSVPSTSCVRFISFHPESLALQRYGPVHP